MSLRDASGQLSKCVGQLLKPSSTNRLPLCLQITRGLLQKYGAERVRDTPITEVRPTPLL
jgi:hypothetical protein